MYAIVDVLGKQIKVTQGAYVYAPRIQGNEGDIVTLDRTLMVVGQDGDPKVGSPIVAGAKVSCKILEQVKADKVIVFKKNRRKGFKLKRGHRQPYTKLHVESISA